MGLIIAALTLIFSGVTVCWRDLFHQFSSLARRVGREARATPSDVADA